MRLVDTVGRHVHGVVGWLIFGTVSLALFLTGVLAQVAVLPLDPERRTSLWITRMFWGRVLFAVMPFWRLRPQGILPSSPGPFVIVSNHCSVLDIPVALTLPYPLRVVARHQLFWVPLMGWFMALSRQIALESRRESQRGTRRDTRHTEAWDEMLAACRRNLENGVSVLVFPEGTRSADGTVGKFHVGAFRMAQELGVPVLPLVVVGTRWIIGKGVLWPRKWVVDVRFRVLPVVSASEFATPRELAQHVRAQIAQGVSAGQQAPLEG